MKNYKDIKQASRWLAEEVRPTPAPKITGGMLAMAGASKAIVATDFYAPFMPRTGESGARDDQTSEIGEFSFNSGRVEPHDATAGSDIRAQAKAGYEPEKSITNPKQVTASRAVRPVAPPVAQAKPLRVPDATPLKSVSPVSSELQLDPVFEATVEEFRRTGFPIGKSDEIYAVMEFMHLAMRGMEGRFRDERRVEMELVFGTLKNLLEKTRETVTANRQALDDQKASAELLSKRLLFISREASSNFAAAFNKLHADAVREMDKAATDSVDSAKKKFDGSLRNLVREETRIGMVAGVEIAVVKVNESLNNAAVAVDRALRTAEIRARKGWFANYIEKSSGFAIATNFMSAVIGICMTALAFKFN